AIPSCHASGKDATFMQHQLILSKGKSYDQLVNAGSFNAAAKADGLMRVKPGDADNSLLVHKLHRNAGHHGGDYGNPMPLGLDKLTLGQLEFIEEWIKAGAPRTGEVADPKLLDDKTPQPDYFEPLAMPAAGYQMTIGPFSVAPNFEREFFTYRPLGNQEQVYINRFEFKMRDNSHHLIIYDFKSNTPVNAMPKDDSYRDIRNQDGTLNFQNLGALAYHVFVSGSQVPYFDYRFPEGVAWPVPANMKFDINSHYVNKGSEPFAGEIMINIHTVPAAQVVKVAKALNLGNQSISLPPNQRTTLSKTFNTDKTIKVFSLTSHTHKLGETFLIKISGGSRDGEIVYQNDDWHHPVIQAYDPPITLSPGEGLTSVITYNNTTTRTVTFGLTSEDEMGIIFGYYYEQP
ncbi:MAG: hypothetical protein ACKORJ_11320, partial [Bacteroidota bacterium]